MPVQVLPFPDLFNERKFGEMEGLEKSRPANADVERRGLVLSTGCAL
jgi:hypothetical protein